MRIRLIDAVLVGSGLLMGWAATADYYEQRIKNLEEDYDWDRNRILAMAHQMVEEASQGSDVAVSEEVEKVLPGELPVNEVIDEDEPFDEAIYEERRSNLQKIINKYVSDPEAVQQFQDMVQGSEVADNRPPFVISRSSFSWDEEGDAYDKTTLTFYPTSRVLVDEEEELVDSVDTVIGWRNLNQFGFESEDPDVVFVRNPRLETDYEVVRDTENQPPIHIQLGMDLEEYKLSKAAGLLRFRPEDE